MIRRLASAYVYFLLVLEMLLLAASFSLHVYVFAGGKGLYADCGSMLFRGAVAMGFPATPFVKDSFRWVAQIKSCPKWMWRAALTLGVYGLYLGLLTLIFESASSSGNALTLSGVPLGFEAISVCILYSVLREGYREKSEVVRRVRYSIILVAVGVMFRYGWHRGSAR